MKKSFCLSLLLILALNISKVSAIIDKDSLLYLITKPIDKTIEAVKKRYLFIHSVTQDYPAIAIKLGDNLRITAQKMGLPLEMAKSHLLIGDAKRSLGDYSNALENYLQSESLFDSLNDDIGIAICQSNIAITYSDLFNLKNDSIWIQKAFASAYKAEQILSKTELAIQYGVILNNIGTYHTAIDQHDSAQVYFSKALNLRKNIQDSSGMGSTYNNLCLNQMKLGNYEQAIAYGDSAIIIKENTFHFFGLSLALDNLGETYTLMGEFNKAEEVLKRALIYADTVNSDHLRVGVFHKFRILEEERNNFRKALEYEQKLNEIKLKLEKETHGSKIENLELNHTLKQRDTELALLNQEKQNQQIIRYTIVGVAILLLAFFYYIFRSQKTKLEKENLLEISKKQLELETAQFKEQELQQRLDFKNKELTSFTVNFIQKNKMLEMVKSIANELITHSDSDIIRKKISKLERLISRNQNEEKQWADFKKYFDNVHKDFFTNLKNEYPELTSSDLKHGAMVLLNLNVKEASSIFGVEPRSIKTARYRLKKKLKLEPRGDLLGFLMNLDRRN